MSDEAIPLKHIESINLNVRKFFIDNIKPGKSILILGKILYSYAGKQLVYEEGLYEYIGQHCDSKISS